jgi:hypothetical protein
VLDCCQGITHPGRIRHSDAIRTGPCAEIQPALPY